MNNYIAGYMAGYMAKEAADAPINFGALPKATALRRKNLKRRKQRKQKKKNDRVYLSADTLDPLGSTEIAETGYDLGLQAGYPHDQNYFTYRYAPNKASQLSAGAANPLIQRLLQGMRDFSFEKRDDLKKVDYNPWAK